MKKLLSMVLIICMIAGLCSVPAFASDYATPDADGYYLNADFENGLGGFEATNSNVSLTVVPSTTAGVGGNGKVLQVTSTAADSANTAAFGADVNFANPIPVDKKLVFETRIKAPNRTGSYKYLFAIYGANRLKSYGLARLAVPGGGINYYSVNPSSNTRYDVSNPLKNANNEIETLTTTDWYRIKVIYNNGVTESISLYSDAGVLLASGDYSEYSTQNHDYPPAQIDKIRFAQAAADTIYLDEVKIYEYTPFALADSFTGVFAAGATTITIPFNQTLDDSTLDNITIEGVNAANPTITSMDVDGSNLILTLTEGLIGSASYRVNLTGLAAQDGSELDENYVLIQTESASVEGMHIDADFENGVNPFNVITNTMTGDSAGTVAIVDATSDSVVGADAGKVLKISSTTNGNAITAEAEFTTPISLSKKPIVMEARFMNSGIYAENKALFSLASYTNTNRKRGEGLAYMSRPQLVNADLGTYYNYSVFASGDSKTCFMDSEDKTKPLVLSGQTWYRIKIVYDETGEKTIIKSMQLFDNADNLIQSIINCETFNCTYPLSDISKIGFGIARTWGTENILYIDDVKVYDMPNPLSLIGASVVEDAEVSPVEIDSVTFDFSERIDSNTLNNFVVKADNVPVAYTAELVGDSTQVKVTFTGGLLGGKNYTVDYSAVADINGSGVTGMLSFSTKSGLFVKNIEYTTGSIVAGAEVAANVNFYNATDLTETATVIAAVYEKVGNVYQLTAVTPMIDTNVAVGRVSIPIKVTVPGNASITNTEVKIFVIENMSTLTPLSAATSFSAY